MLESERYKWGVSFAYTPLILFLWVVAFLSGRIDLDLLNLPHSGHLRYFDSRGYGKGG